MVRAFLRLVILLIVLVAVGAFLLGWWGTRKVGSGDAPRETVGTTGVNTERARQVGAEVGERTAAAANEAKRALAEGQTTAKIKAKIALDGPLNLQSFSNTKMARTAGKSGRQHWDSARVGARTPSSRLHPTIRRLHSALPRH